MAFVIQSEVNFRIRDLDLHLCSRGTITEVWPQDLKAPESLPCQITHLLSRRQMINKQSQLH